MSRSQPERGGTVREPRDAFHLAIGVRDLDETHHYYVTGLGCRLARRYADRLSVDFFGDHLVCHLSVDVPEVASLYPRHFGVTFRDRADWDRMIRLAEIRGLHFHTRPYARFENLVEEHGSFVLQDPSNNLIEFKHYADPRMMY